jgi:ferric-dicitrate binding protein FerR (iron transport regulator)
LVRYWKALVLTALIFLIKGATDYLTNHSLRLGSAPKPPVTPLTPGHYEGIVTLDDGSKQMVDSTGITEPFRITLPDSTKVCLGYGSSLRYAPEFNGDRREVFVTGLADFEVAPDVKRPFVVHTPRTSVWVLGTHFNVADYPDEPTAEVTLLDGKVQVQHGSEILQLKVAEQAIVNKDRMKVRRLDHSMGSIGWADVDPYLEFPNTDLYTALRRVARWYQVKIVNLELANGISVIGSIWLGNTLAQNLKVLEDAENGAIHLEIKDDTIFLSAGKPHR